MATIKTSAHANQAKTVHAGANVAVCRVSLSATFSAGDIHYVGRIPHGAVVTDVVFLPGAALGKGIFKIGVNGNSASYDAFFTSDTYSQAIYTCAVLNALGTRGRPLYSLSDERIVRFSDVTFVTTATTSVGHIGDIVLKYTLDDPSK